MLSIITNVAPLFFLIGLGLILKATKIADEKWIEVLNKFGLFVAFPAIIFLSLSKIDRANIIGLDIIGKNIIILLGIMGIVFLITKFIKLEKKVRNTYVICAFFGNCAYLGFPFITSVIPGSEGSVSIHIAIYLFILFTIGILYLEHANKRKKKSATKIILNMIKNPLLLSVILGFCFLSFEIKIPPLFEKTLEMLAASGSPVVLLALGMFMSKQLKLNKYFIHSIILSGIKIIIVPGIFIAFGWYTNTIKQFNVSILEAAMPMALTPFALAEIYPLHKEIISNSIVVSTIVGIFTLPYLVSVLV